MKSANFVFFLFAVGFSSISAEDNSENEYTTDRPSESGVDEIESKPTEKNPKYRPRQRQPNHLVTPDQQLIEPRRYYPQLVQDPTAPDLGFPILGNRRQNIYLRDHTGKYNVRLQNLQGANPNFHSALGVISAHILNHKSNQEYIPYPPNGDPYNYPAYRGHPRATEPPVIGAYERASNSNYDVRPVDFVQQNPRRFFSPNDYQPGFSNQFQTFGQDLYRSSDFFNEGSPHNELRRDFYPIYESRWYDRREERPIK